jgi:4-diphosphocytidyl-2-C-methyl-D-erythritol kinase
MGTGHLSTGWPAPAKLNLFLHVTGRRVDGFHELQTVFQFLDYGDELSFDTTGDGRIERAGTVAGVPADRDLAVRAARLLQAETGTDRGAVIRVDKRIPLGGGLGGGSSDAATALVALNHLWGTALTRDALAGLGLCLGADVPVFVSGRAAWAEGVGERLSALDLPEPWYVVVDPGAQVSTAEVYADPELTRNTPPITIRDFRAGLGRNDLEPVVRRRSPEVDRALEWLTGFGHARMSGSGGCVFVETAGPREGEAILSALPAGMRGFVARGVNRSPLFERLALPLP